MTINAACSTAHTASTNAPQAAAQKQQVQKAAAQQAAQANQAAKVEISAAARSGAGHSAGDVDHDGDSH